MSEGMGDIQASTQAPGSFLGAQPSDAKSIVERFSRDVENECRRVREQCSALHELADRLVGSVPEVAGDAGPTAVPVGHVGQLQQSVESLAMASGALEHAVSRVRDALS